MPDKDNPVPKVMLLNPPVPLLPSNCEEVPVVALNLLLNVLLAYNHLIELK